ncbi:hypothetical protein [Cohnella cholangitidis]|uniref:Uncharacterized protein n=1 Tax=Cohnella cholangitidis TaxID=2598458 RepID=A0A7G5BXJ0_9BACL|nr:hypothetical protein [Cohnella cholangitidis]QMV41674.1 hypothetical protein FPL14_11130 [Cohnella cholangitidis]
MNIVSVCGTIDLSNHERESRLESLNSLFKTLYDQQEIVQELWIDGVVYREDYNNHLLENLMKIKSIEIKTVHETILVSDLTSELNNYLPKLIRACDSISELFYGEMKDEDWNHFGQLTEGIQWVGQSAHVLLTHEERLKGMSPIQSTIISFVAELEKQIAALDASLQQGDHTAAGDLIKYELPDVFKLLLDQLESGVHS